MLSAHITISQVNASVLDLIFFIRP